MKLLKGFSKISAGNKFYYYKGAAIGLAAVGRVGKNISLWDTVKVPLTTECLIANGFNPIGVGEYETN